MLMTYSLKGRKEKRKGERKGRRIHLDLFRSVKTGAGKCTQKVRR